MSELSAIGGTHGAEMYFEQVIVRGYVNVIPYRRFTDMFNQKERSYLMVQKGLTQPATQPPPKQDGQYEILVPRTAPICATFFQEGTPPRAYNPNEYKSKRIAQACFVSFGPYAALGYIHLREGNTLMDTFEIITDDFIPFTSVNLYYLAQTQMPPRPLDLLVVNRHRIEALYLM